MELYTHTQRSLTLSPFHLYLRILLCFCVKLCVLQNLNTFVLGSTEEEQGHCTEVMRQTAT